MSAADFPSPARLPGEGEAMVVAGQRVVVAAFCSVGEDLIMGMMNQGSHSPLGAASRSQPQPPRPGCSDEEGMDGARRAA